jgi:DNA replicative helicase MCM subunit Mcm2 (Cdc46/Mcm family)
LIYLILDKPDVAHDRRLAKHLVSLYYEEPPKRASPIPAGDLAEYISFAKQVSPFLFNLVNSSKLLLAATYYYYGIGILM